MGYQMHRAKFCTYTGEDIEGTNCSGVKCKIKSDEYGEDNNGLYNITCSGITGSYICIYIYNS